MTAPIELLSTKEAAEYLRCSVTFLAKSRMVGNGPCYTKVGNRVFYRQRDLNEYINRNLRFSTVAKAHPDTGQLPPAEV